MSLAVLRRFDLTVLRDKSTTDQSQIPLAGAQIDFYRQGATVSDDRTVAAGSSQAVPVYSVGELQADSLVQAGVGGRTLTVVSRDSPTQVTLQNDTDAAISLDTGTRLILLSDRPEVYADPFGTSGGGATSLRMIRAERWATWMRAATITSPGARRPMTTTHRPH